MQIRFGYSVSRRPTEHIAGNEAYKVSNKFHCNGQPAQQEVQARPYTSTVGEWPLSQGASQSPDGMGYERMGIKSCLLAVVQGYEHIRNIHFSHPMCEVLSMRQIKEILNGLPGLRDGFAPTRSTPIQVSVHAVRFTLADSIYLLTGLAQATAANTDHLPTQTCLRCALWGVGSCWCQGFAIQGLRGSRPLTQSSQGAP